MKHQLWRCSGPGLKHTNHKNHQNIACLLKHCDCLGPQCPAHFGPKNVLPAGQATSCHRRHGIGQPGHQAEMCRVPNQRGKRSAKVPNSQLYSQSCCKFEPSFLMTCGNCSCRPVFNTLDVYIYIHCICVFLVIVQSNMKLYIFCLTRRFHHFLTFSCAS